MPHFRNEARFGTEAIRFYAVDLESMNDALGTSDLLNLLADVLTNKLGEGFYKHADVRRILEEDIATLVATADKISQTRAERDRDCSRYHVGEPCGLVIQEHKAPEFTGFDEIEDYLDACSS